MVLNCLPRISATPPAGYCATDRLSAADADSKVVTALSEHLTRARERVFQ